ncbi:BTAD domain-containing putative transcriptional regulator [Nocardiopsis valliformis]|uniref:BTAD domain-containing putative transcriptional regulator n=1 Tax=Nocardiopsis valliformis TaxID=239974 RepID=UPI001360B24F|nr:BTAD domain-containing putative transcriptional regulator [Nocardiopsis valliformis]
MTEILVLGPVRASTNGRDHRLGGPKQQALLACLALARGRALPLEQLVADLWDGAPPRDPVHALQARISRLRSVLPVQIDFLDGGYRLAPATVQTDAARFERLCEQADLLLEEGNPVQAAGCLHSALGLWRGQAFAGLPDIPVLYLESVRLDKLRAAALADRIDADLALGRSESVIPELHALVEGCPVSERHWGQLMTALYCAGRAQEALDVFTRARASFVERLGAEPNGELGRLHTRILREQPPETLLRLPQATPVPGWLDHADEGSDTLTGRALTSNQTDALVALVRGRRTVILTGPAGIGKTHLLRAVGARFEARHCLAPLLAASPLTRAVPLGVFAGALPQQWASPLTVIDYFARHRSTTLLLVDNVDQLDETSLFVIIQLLRNSKVPTILTARDITRVPEGVQALYDSGELTEVVVGPLPDADADEFAARMLGGSLTPDARPLLCGAARGNPLHLREVITASLEEGRLVRTGHGWELRGAPASTSRLTQLVGERFEGLDDPGLEAAARVAVAGEYPPHALDTEERRALTRAGVVEYSVNGWLRLAHPLDAEYLRARCSAALWRDLTHEVVRVLLGDATAGPPAARRRAHVLALDLDLPIDPRAVLALAEHALGTFDERLALRAAEAVAADDSGNAHAHRIAGLAASALGASETADAHFEAARRTAVTAAEQTAVALAHARHLGLRHHDAAGALTVIREALRTVGDPAEADHLRRDETRWAMTAGQGGEMLEAPAQTPDAAAVLGLITVSVAGVITGPLDDAELALARLRRVPRETIELVPGGASLIGLTEIMALSNTGDIVATRRRLEQAITDAKTREPASLGMWEYALGFVELLSGDAARARSLGAAASAHLEWRDTTGLLPAARALTGAAAQATGHTATSEKEFGAIPSTAHGDPKVVMLRAWAQAWQENTMDRPESAARILLDASGWLLTVQHSYFAAILAHCAVRTGERLAGAVAALGEARSVAGGGLLDLFLRHGAATAAGDRGELEAVARNARELGMATTAVDTWRHLARTPVDEDGSGLSERHHRISADRLRAETPMMVLWSGPA